MPSVVVMMEKSKIDVCNLNTDEMERHYEVYLGLEAVEFSECVFLQYLHS